MNTSNHPPQSPSPSDQQWMRYALALAAKGEGHVEPNPMVGCVIVKDDVPIGEGYHESYGGPHAERNALASVSQDVGVHGATWYVTLEPCCHTGKTPPCTEAVIASKPSRVIIAALDPFEQVSGRGVAQLQDAGIEVVTGVCEEQSCRLTAPYRKRVTRRKPWVIAKWAMTLDGKIATHTGDSHWISGEASRAKVHQLRGRVDAIVTGISTVKSDDPLLTARPPGPRTPCRIVFDRRGQTSTHSALVKSVDDAPVVIVCRHDAPEESIGPLREAGCQVLPISESNPTSMADAFLDWCYDQGMTNVMIEAGGTLVSSFFRSGMIDEYHVYIAGKVIGGGNATTPVEGLGLDRIADSPVLEPLQVEAIDGDLFVSTRRKSPLGA